LQQQLDPLYQGTAGAALPVVPFCYHHQQDRAADAMGIRVTAQKKVRLFTPLLCGNTTH